MPSLVNINSISPQLRDILLGLNLQPSPTITNNSYVQFLNGVGLPFTVSYGTGVLAPTQSLQELGAIWRVSTYSYNQYQAEPTDYTDSGDAISNATIGFNANDIKPSYLDANGKLNIKNGNNDNAYNIITSLIKGGVGFNKIGGGEYSVVGNNDIRNTIVGRALAAGGIIEDTKLGTIGAQRLAESLANNAAFKLQKETIGRVNLDIFSWIDGKKDDFIVPNYEITVPAGRFGKTLDFIGDLAGFTVPRSQMSTEFFSFDDKFKPTLIGNIARANGMIASTGKGQVLALFRNMQANLNTSNFIKQGYAPGIVNRRVDGDDAIRFNVYAYDDPDGEILENTDLYRPDSAQYGNERWTSVEGSGFEADYFNFKTYGNGGNGGNWEPETESDFVWSDEKYNNDKNASEDLLSQADSIFGDSHGTEESNLYQFNRKSILYKTKELFKSGYMSTLVNGHGIDSNNVTQIQSAVHKNKKSGKYVMSKGNAALTKLALDGDFSDYAKIFCRTWTPMDKYDSVYDLVRHSKLDVNGGTYKRRSPLSEYSVLENTGFVKIANYLNDTGSIKRYMFSIENLAFRDVENLPNCERGPYDGRIMWFPPYDIKFSESTSVNWDKHNFIGRGEPMYTYNNTERTGQLSFKVIIDHPNQLNVKKSNIIKDDEHFYSFFAGCNPLDLLTPEQKNKNDKDTKPDPKIIVDQPTNVEPSRFNVFFPNDNWEYPNNNPQYESGLADSGSTSAVVTIVETKAERKKKLEPENYNNYMGYSKADKKTHTGTKLGPASPIGLSADDYDAKKIDYTTYPAGEYLGLGMTVNSVKTVSAYTLKYTDVTNFGLNANRHDTGTEYDVKDANGNTTKIGNLLEIPNVGKWSGWLAGSGVDMSGSPLKKSYLEALKEYMHHDTGPCKNCIIEIFGYASQQGSVSDTETKNQTLSNKRANNIRTYMLSALIDPNDPMRNKRIVVTKGNGETNYFNEFATYKDANGSPVKDECDEKNPNNSNVDALGCKLNRRVAVIFKNKPDLRTNGSTPNQSTTISPNAKATIKTLVDAMYSECDYFQKLSQNDPFTYSKITDKIKYFTPAFHSTTPEGFNARLTFLQQCTRQGPSIYTNTEKPDNLVFGRPPVCILRIGDFYYTKIIIESVSFDFEPLVWDLNPEGVGVQPMIANVSMNFAFIGGSSLDGPITKLQNGISRNYFANTPLYDSNADDNGAIKTPEINNLLGPKDANELDPDVVQNADPIKVDKALTAKQEDTKILQAGKLTLRFDDSGLFQGKIKGNFTIDSKLSKEYNIKIRAYVFNSDPRLKGDEYVDNQNLKLNETKIDISSKTKTTNSLQKWDYFLTDAMYKSVNAGFNDIYKVAQDDLNQYVDKNTEVDAGNRDKGWEFSSRNYLPDSLDNERFYVDIDELDIKLEFHARWVPKFKAKVLTDTKTEEDPVTGEIINTTTYTYEAYLSGGKLDILNKKNQSPDEVEAANKAQKKKEKDAKKAKAKADKEQEKIDKATRKEEIAKQKAAVAKGKGSLLK